MEITYSRWSDEKRLRKDGTLVPFEFSVEHDLPVVQLFHPLARDPWGYRYLPSSYIPKLLGRSHGGLSDRLTLMQSKPHEILKLPTQAHKNGRDRIFSIGPNGYEKLRSNDIYAPFIRTRELKHELLACMIAASFDYGAQKHGLVIEPAEMPDVNFRPDWPLFTISGKTVWIEADTGSETLDYNENAITIEGKFYNYLDLIKAGGFVNSIAVFVTPRISRMHSMMDRILCRVIDETKERDEQGKPTKKNKYTRDMADHFAFQHILFEDKEELRKLAKLTDWAVAENWHRATADAPTFNFLSADR